MTPAEATVKQSSGNLPKLKKRVPSRNDDNYVKQRKQRQKEITALEVFARKMSKLLNVDSIIILMFCTVIFYS